MYKRAFETGLLFPLTSDGTWPVFHLLRPRMKLGLDSGVDHWKKNLQVKHPPVFLCKRWDHISPCSWTQHTQPVKLKADARTQEAKPHEVTRGEEKEPKPNLQPASSLVFIGSQQPGASWLASRTACKLKCLHVTFLHSLVVRTAPSVCQPPHSHRLLVPAQEES